MSDSGRPSRRIAAGVVLAGLLLGAASAWAWLQQGSGRGDVYSGWTGSKVTGSVEADPWTRAKVAVSGLLALSKSQAIYFARNTDDNGERLREDCRYAVSGGKLPGQWWSVTVYAADNFLPLNNDDALSFDATEVVTDAAGQWSGILAPQRPANGAWASTRNAGSYDITLRIYQPNAQAQADFRTIPMPSVRKLDCGGQS
jgi:hypothetical protein